MMHCPICGNSDGIIKNGFNRGTQRYKCIFCEKGISPVISHDEEVLEQNVRFKKDAQRYQDISRIERKSFREQARIENSLCGYNKELIQILNQKNLGHLVKSHENADGNDAVAIVHISDTHFNELVDLEHNKYDFVIASKRLHKFAQRIKMYLGPLNIKNVFIALTGDLLNSDRRLDEILNMATNRSNATFLAVDLLKSFILDLNDCFNLSIGCVSGNESRLNKETGFTDILATDNYDFTIFNILRYVLGNLEEESGINFISGDPVELLVNVAGQHVLLTHGLNMDKDIEKKVQQVAGRYSAQGQQIDYMIFGHTHSCRIGDIYSRSSSLVGSNAYSERGLNCSGRASQNVYVFYGDGSRDGIKVDLQNTEGVPGYPLEVMEDCYNPKAPSKNLQKRTIMEIVI